jgi:tetratricopeptide (TPR) repeat protein
VRAELMLDLGAKTAGELGSSVYFSDLLAAAAFGQYTGTITLKVDGGEMGMAFREGNPLVGAGSAFTEERLGDILVGDGAAAPGVIDGALLAQAAFPAAERPLLGELLLSSGDCTADAIASALERQLPVRLERALAVTSGRWTATAGETGNTRKMRPAVDGLGSLHPLIKRASSDGELREIGDRYLGSALKLKLPTATVERLMLDPVTTKALRYLDKPRKAHQIEQAVGDRRGVRALLKALTALDGLEVLPMRQSIPIKDVTRVAVPRAESGASPPAPVGSGFTAAEPPKPQPAPAPAAPPPPPAPKLAPEFLAELQQLSDAAGTKNHFELLGVTQETNDKDLRAKFTELAKRFHPDALGPGAAPEIAGMCRTVSAALNEAYTTLSDAEKRKAYLVDLSKGIAGKDPNPAGAKVKYEMGLVHLKKAEFAKAREMFKLAIDMAPSNCLYHASYGWSWFSDAKMARKEAIPVALKALKDATDLDKNEPNVWFWYGRVLKEKGDLKEARRCFEICVRMMPKHADAAREIRLMEMREAKGEGDDKKSALSKLFKR